MHMRDIWQAYIKWDLRHAICSHTNVQAHFVTFDETNYGCHFFSKDNSHSWSQFKVRKNEVNDLT